MMNGPTRRDIMDAQRFDISKRRKNGKSMTIQTGSSDSNSDSDDATSPASESRRGSISSAVGLPCRYTTGPFPAADADANPSDSASDSSESADDDVPFLLASRRGSISIAVECSAVGLPCRFSTGPFPDDDDPDDSDSEYSERSADYSESSADSETEFECPLPTPPESPAASRVARKEYTRRDPKNADTDSAGTSDAVYASSVIEEHDPKNADTGPGTSDDTSVIGDAAQNQK